MKTAYRHIWFEEIEPKPKTKQFMIRSNAGEGDSFLGYIKWYGPWRRYCLFTLPDIVFDAECLEDIQDFLKNLMLERK